MKAGINFYQYVTAGTALLALVNSGLHFGWTSAALPQLTSNSSSYQITNDEGSWIVISLLMSSIPSSFLGVLLYDRIGRKNCILLTAFPHFVAWVIIAFAESALLLVVARLLAGISDGIAFPVMSLYITEISDPSIRGFLGSGLSVSFVFGILLSNIIGTVFTITGAAVICAAFSVILLVTFVWMPESPYFLIMKQRYEDARATLKKLKGRSDVDDELLRLQQAVESQNRNRTSFLELFTKRANLKRLGVLVVVRNAQQFSGATAITFYTFSIFERAGDFVKPITATIIFVSIQCVMNGVGGVFLDKAGRKPLLIISLAGSAFSLLVEGTYFYLQEFTTVDTSSFSFLPVVALVGFVVLFNVGAQPIPLLIQAEIFPLNVKALAFCISEMYFCILAALAAKCFQVMRDEVGMYLPFYGFGVCCVLNIFYVIWLVPETKGKTLEEIQNE